MVSFESDYNNGAHSKVLSRLIETNEITEPGYGKDSFTAKAVEKIKKAVGKNTAEVVFLTGGTQTNAVIIDTLLDKFEGVIAATTGHVSLHEAGAIERTGHKVIEIPGYNGKVHADDFRNYLETFYADSNHEHMVYPGMLYISHPTEYGTLYTKNELKELKEICEEYRMSMFLDGARLAYGLASKNTDVTLPDLAEYTDVFYIGGTKCGALCGEAVVFTHSNKPEHFENLIKRQGALLAKGRLCGVQFDALFTDNLYGEIGNHAIEMAEKVKKIFTEKGYKFFIDSPTNQQFVVLENSKMPEIEKHVKFGFWEKYDENHTVVRFATSWATKNSDIDELEKWV